MATDPQTCLTFIAGLARLDSPNSLGEISNILMFDSRGDLDQLQRTCMTTVLAWAHDRETDNALREDFAMAFDILSDGAPTSAVALALVVPRLGAGTDDEVVSSLREKLRSTLEQSGVSLAELRNQQIFEQFSAPFWLTIAAGLAHPSPTRPPTSWHRPILRLQPRTIPHPTPACSLSRERRTAGRMLHFLLDKDLVDRTSGTALSCILAWSVEADATAPDRGESMELLAALQSFRLPDPDVEH